MSQILIVHYYKSIVDGVMTSLIDLFFNLRKYFDVRLLIICPEFYLMDHDDFYDFHLNDTEFIRNGERIEFEEFAKDEKNEVTCSIPFLKFNKNFGDPKLFYSVMKPEWIGEKIRVGSRITICSARLLYEKMMGRLNLYFRMGLGSLFILDSLDLYKSKVNAVPNLDIAIPKNLKSCFYLSNPANFIDKKKNIEYYHKFSKERLDTLPDIGVLKNVFEYSRKDKEKIKVKDMPFENIGKGIFEHLYHNKTVNYYADHAIKDGLYYYLKLFGIDGLKNNVPLKISREEIEDKLFMKNDDEIIKLIEDILS